MTAAATVTRHDPEARASGTSAAPATTYPVRRPVRRPHLGLARLAARLAASVAALWVLVTITFLGLRLTGNPVLALVGPEATTEQIDSLTTALGYDRPLVVQYWDFLQGVALGHFGTSVQYGRPALEVVLGRLPATATLAVTGILGGLLLGAGSGWLAAFGRRRYGAGVPLAVLTAIQAFPVFFKGLVLMLVFAVTLRWFPTGGFTSWAGLVLPALTLALATAPAIGRVYRVNLVQAEHQPHVQTAVAKGLAPSKVRRAHVVRNALLPLSTIVGLQLATLFGGALIIEKVFSWPGLGQLVFNSIESQDYPVVLASTVVIGIAFLVITLVTDEVNRLIDPRGESRP